jgi:hypothetical protein
MRNPPIMSAGPERIRSRDFPCDEGPVMSIQTIWDKWNLWLILAALGIFSAYMMWRGG